MEVGMILNIKKIIDDPHVGDAGRSQFHQSISFYLEELHHTLYDTPFED
jgi:hypothetical protein